MEKSFISCGLLSKKYGALESVHIPKRVTWNSGMSRKPVCVDPRILPWLHSHKREAVQLQIYQLTKGSLMFSPYDLSSSNDDSINSLALNESSSSGVNCVTRLRSGLKIKRGKRSYVKVKGRKFRIHSFFLHLN